MEDILMIIMAAGAILGGLDRLFGNRFGLGGKFEEGFHLLGPVALAQAGIICAAPLLSQILGPAVSAAYHALGQDPGMFGSILALDMGGYQMAALLADDPQVGRFAGIVVASMLGCTVSFTIPVGMAFLPKERQDDFARGILYGLIALPVALVIGAVLCGMDWLAALWLCLPVVALAVLLGVGLMKFPTAMVRGFRVFAGMIKAITTIGLTIGAVQYMTGWTILPTLAPLKEAMEVVASIGIVLLGALPMAEIMQRLLKQPMARLGRLLHIGEKGAVNLLICFVSSTPALAAMKDMEARDVMVNAAFAVSAASCLSAHLGFVLAVEPTLTMPMVVSKLLGGVLGAGLAVWLGRERAEQSGNP